jgi:23S rRNA (adenine1618-N6)-methyltransferase
MLWTATNAFQKNALSMASLSRKMVVRRSGTVVSETSGNSGSSLDRKLEHRSSPKLKSAAAVSEKRRQKRQQQQQRQQQHQKDGASKKSTDSRIANDSVISSRRRIHPRNAFQGSYDMDRLCAAHPNLSQFIIPAAESRSGRSTIDFSNASSVRALNAALLAADYGVHSWEEHLPTNSLCPPVPGRADYIHYLADVLAESFLAGAGAAEATGETGPDGGIGEKKQGQRVHIPTGPTIRGLDIGTGSSIIYPLIGTQTYGWSFIGTDVNQHSIESANRIISSATDIIEKGVVQVRWQSNREHVLLGDVLHRDEKVDFAMCNPPFYESAEAFRQANERKVRNLAWSTQKRRHKKGLVMSGGTSERGTFGNSSSKQERSPPTQSSGSNNFGGEELELWCPGGEVAFVQRIIDESRHVAKQCLWFSSLVSRRENIPVLLRSLSPGNNVSKGGVLSKVRVSRIVEMGQGQKSSSILLWSFFDEKEQADWYKGRRLHVPVQD